MTFKGINFVSLKIDKYRTFFLFLKEEATYSPYIYREREAKRFYDDAPVVQVENRIEAVRFIAGRLCKGKGGRGGWADSNIGGLLFQHGRDSSAVLRQLSAQSYVLAAGQTVFITSRLVRIYLPMPDNVK